MISLESSLTHTVHDTLASDPTINLSHTETIPHSEGVNLFLNDASNAILNSHIYGSIHAPNSSPSLRENHTESISTFFNQANTSAKTEFHLSKFTPDTTCDMVIDYMLKRGVPESMQNEFNIFLLVPKDRDTSTLSFVSFKIDVSNDVANIITKINFWPSLCILKNFIRKTKTVSTYYQPISQRQIECKFSEERVFDADCSKLMFENIDGISHHKCPDLLLSTSALDYDVISFTETWLTPGFNNSEL